DILGKSLGAPNAINTARATIDCLKKLKLGEEVARARGKNLEDLLPKGVLAVLAEQEQAQAVPIEEESPAEAAEPEAVAVSEGEASA
ncbi:MAG TPA: hypothetical protein DCL60_05135, partial [Armatimonadetes bacterium]|nr:hypothetical protein [Armatimonadota bacterium]